MAYPVRLTREEREMYIMSSLDYAVFPIRVDEVTTVANENTGFPELSVLATVLLRRGRLDRPDVTVPLLLWAQESSIRVIQPETEFVMREAVVEGFAPPKDARHKPGRVGIGAIWFDDPSDTMLGAVLAQVRRDLRLSERDAFLQLINLD